MYKVFVNRNILVLNHHPIKKMEGCKEIWHIPFSESTNFHQIIEQLEKDYGYRVCINLYHSDLPLLWKKYRKHYELVRAAGGLVMNPAGKLLFIYRNDKWDLPKGKTDPHEEFADTAIREVREECGFQDIVILDYLTDTYHTYGDKKSRKLKKTSWYLMHSEETNLVPQEEEGITAIKWIKPEKLAKIWKNTYPSVVDVVKMELDKKKVVYPVVPWDDNVCFE